MKHNTEFQHEGHAYNVTWVHSGQYRPYGDTFRVAEIRTDETNKLNVLEAISIFDGYDVPEKKDWNPHQIDSYFRGYCEIEKTDYGWKYTKCEPYTD